MRSRRALIALALLAGCGDNTHLGRGHLLISPSTGLRTNETGATATFTVALTMEPTSDVHVAISSFDPSEGTVSPATLTFTPDDFDVPQVVTAKGVDDTRADGNRAYTVRLDGGRLGVVDLSISNDDDDTAGFYVSPIVGLTTSEAGQQASFTVRLLSQPADDVRIPVSSSDPTEGLADRIVLDFAPDAWNVDQTITVSGVADGITDGDVPYSIVLGTSTSADPGYDGLDPDNVLLVNVDANVRGVAVTPPAGLQTSETGTTATVSVVLQTPPTANVTIPVTSSNVNEATVSAAQLVFTSANWNTPQTITVTGVNDFVVDGTQGFTIQLGAVTSTDPAYSGLDPADVTGSNADDDTIGVRVTAVTPLQTNESGGTATFTVTLASQPTQDVTVPLATSDPTEGTISPAQLVFTAANWNQPHAAVVTGVDDLIADGDVSYTVVLNAAISSDALYNGVDAPDLAAINHDNDTPGFVVDPLSVMVSEFGDTDVFTIVLTAPPTANVTIGLTSSDVTEATVAPTSVTFTPANWSVPQQVTVTGVNDNLLDGNIAFTIATAAAVSADPAYAGLDPPDVAGINLDNDTAQVYVKSKPSLNVSENGTSATFRVRLTTAPTAAVTCTLQSSDLTEGTVSPVSLTFTPGNFGYQTITVTGVDDLVKDGDIAFTILMLPCTSADSAYNGADPRDVAAVCKDND